MPYYVLLRRLQLWTLQQILRGNPMIAGELQADLWQPGAAVPSDLEPSNQDLWDLLGRQPGRFKGP